MDKKRNGCGRLAYRPLSQPENTSRGFSAKNYRMGIETRDVHAGGVLELLLIRRVRRHECGCLGGIFRVQMFRDCDLWSSHVQSMCLKC